MSGVENSNGPHIIRDPSLDGIPEGMFDAYTGMNTSIASNHYAYGPTLQIEHLQRSRSAILGTAEKALRSSRTGGRRALILGAGNCFDIPLPELVNTFDHVRLVDVDTTTTESALSDLSAHELSKVSLQGADLTGIVSSLIPDIQRVAGGAYELNSFLRSAGSVVQGYVDRLNDQPDVGRDYSFVCSQLLLTQLLSIPMTALNGAIYHKYGDPTAIRTVNPLTINLTDLTHAMQDSHMEFLRKAVAPAGAVHFADTFSEVLQDGSGQSRELPMIHPSFNETLGDHFTELSPPQDWFWQSEPNRLHRVTAYALAPVARS